MQILHKAALAQCARKMGRRGYLTEIGSIQISSIHPQKRGLNAASGEQDATSSPSQLTIENRASVTFSTQLYRHHGHRQ
jgi:hypothetical protein